MMVKMVSGRHRGRLALLLTLFSVVAVYVVGNRVHGSDDNMLPGADNTVCSSRLDGYNRCVTLRL